jgi:predicted nucleic acid-binding protein
MVLADTSIWVSHLRLGEPRLATLLSESDVMCHEFIIGELACGHLKNKREILVLLKALPAAPVISQEELLSFIDHHSLSGQGIGWVDVHLLAAAKLAGVSFWTSDKQLKKAADRLKLS